MEPLVSVIVPVYGTEAFLEQCVDSVLGQTWKNLEILLVDDGSPDRCPEMCDAYAEKDSRVRVIHRENGGLSAARNSGLDAAGGDYIAFADSDDWIGPDMIENLVTACERNGTDLAFCRITYVKQGKPLPLKPQPPEVISAEDLLKDILMHRRGGVNVYNKIYKAKLFSGIRFPVGKWYEDEPVFFPVISRANAVSYTGTADYYYRIHPQSYCNRSFSFEKVLLKREHRMTLRKDLEAYAPQLLPLLKYYAAYADFEMLRFYLSLGGDVTPEEERDMRESFEKSFPDLLYMLREARRERDIREAIWIRLGMWDSIRSMREKAEETERQLPEEIRREVDLEHDAFTQRMFREEEYATVEGELKKAAALQKQQQKLQDENAALRAQVKELTESRSYRIGRAVTRLPGLLRRKIRRP